MARRGPGPALAPRGRRAAAAAAGAPKRQAQLVRSSGSRTRMAYTRVRFRAGGAGGLAQSHAGAPYRPESSLPARGLEPAPARLALETAL